MASTSPAVNTAEEAAAICYLLLGCARILLLTRALHMCRAQHPFERQGLKVLPFPVVFLARGPWAGPFWCDPTRRLHTVRAFYERSHGLRDLIGRLEVRIW